MWTTEELFSRTAKSQLAPVLVLEGEDPYLEREWKKLLAKSRIEVTEVDLKKASPLATHEELAQGGSLFSTRSLVWFKRPAAYSQWKADAKATFKRMVERADGDALTLVLQTAVDKRANWNAVGATHLVPFTVDDSRRGPWLKRMNDQRGAPLVPAQLEYLASFDAELLNLDNWVELWSLGGAVWAEKALGWREGARSAESGAPNLGGQNPAFAWVEAVLRGDRRLATQLLGQLWKNDPEPLQLLALLAKSVKILASVEDGGRAAGAPEFLVNKMRGIARQNAPRLARRGRDLLTNCAQLDRQLKSSSLNPFAALMNL